MLPLTSVDPGTPAPDAHAGIRLSEVISALSYALDLTEGQREGHSVRSCLIGMRIGRELGLDGATLSSLFYALLLKDAGCSSNAARTCELFAADDLTVKRTWKTVDWSRGWDAFVHVARNAGAGAGMRERVRRVAAFASAGPVGTELVQTRCERGAGIARLLGFSGETAGAIHALDEHWDGAGKPQGLSGERIPLLARIACLAQTVEIFHAAGGVGEAVEVARRRAGRWFDPELVRVLRSTALADEPWRTLAGGDPRAALAALEPPDRVLMADDARLDQVAEAFAQVIDAKSPYTFHHSEGVARWAVEIGRVLGLDGARLAELRRAALLHDIGKLGVSNRILDKPARLTDEEMAVVRRHPEHTAQILSRVGRFRELARVAGAHHERMDGKGYHLGVPAGTLPVEARILAVADVYDALSAARPYREALPRDRALQIMRADAGPGTCPECFTALTTALGHAVAD
ncbi:MAG TPA: HD domain-containing phosphohydrolase [Longimicrobium sp.]|nr:HD domain-containing phosphohydrolase [Longimicrobium sp.]